MKNTIPSFGGLLVRGRQGVFAAGAVLVSALMACYGGDGVVQGVHTHTPKNYVAPKEPAVIEHLEWFKDQKFGLMMCMGLYSELGMMESWSLSDQDASWSRKRVEWAQGDDFKRRYLDLIRSFNPVRINAADWAKVAKAAGCKYLIFTTKHHDGFCLWDTKFSDFKTTNPSCPFATNARADIVRHVFDAFRAEGLGISCYFSKPDWHHPDYWDNCGIGIKTTRNPSYNWRKDTTRWNRFRTYTRNQLLELVGNYGKIDVLWLDGGQVRPQNGQNVHMEEILAAARKIQPWLISADRTVGGPCEDFITPEQTVPKVPVMVPWESCITLGTSWGYAFDDTYKSVRTIVHMLVDIVAKGGNLALNVGPRPDGCFPKPAIERLEGIGKWLKTNGAAIYDTRVASPYRTTDWAYTAGRAGEVYAIRLWKDEAKDRARTLTIDCDHPEKFSKVVHLGSGRTLVPTVVNGRLSVTVPADIAFDADADAFKLLK
ncbi:MAG: alpha-L-fucosidase [Kiritimatiellae bacterium]|nr:alpha-L-fucosidase [Kiritimatiellia bacterium]